MTSNADKLIYIRRKVGDAYELGSERISLCLSEALLLLSEIDRLQSIQQERDKLIKGMQKIASNPYGYEMIESMQTVAITILREIGVGEERKGHDQQKMDGSRVAAD